MRRFEIHLCQNEDSAKEIIIECCFNSNKNAMDYTLYKLLDTPKKYKRAFLIDNKGKNLIRIER